MFIVQIRNPNFGRTLYEVDGITPLRHPHPNGLGAIRTDNAQFVDLELDGDDFEIVDTPATKSGQPKGAGTLTVFKDGKRRAAFPNGNWNSIRYIGE